MNKTEKRTRISVVIVTGITFIIMLLTIFTSMIGYSEFTSVIERQYNDAAYEVAYTALSYLNPDRFGHYVETLETDEEFDIIQKRLDELTDSMDVNFIYVGEVDPEGRSIIYIYDSVNSSLGYDRYPLGKVGEDFDPQYNQILKDVIRTGEKPETYLYSYTEWGDHTTALLPVKDSSGKVVSIICVEKTMQVLQQSRNTYVSHVVLLCGAVLIIAVLICIVFLRYYLIRPIGEVTREAERFADDHSMDSDIKAISSRNEIGVLARSVKRMESDIMQYIDNITKITAEKERIGAELSLATSIQSGMLPNMFPPFPDRSEFDIYASMDPAKEVGGDFYDFFLIDDDHLALVIADVSGKGVPAALFMMASKILINDHALMDGTPAEILNRVNKQICSNNEADMFVTVWLGILEISTGKLTAASAGHEYPMLNLNGKYELFKDKHGLAVGAMEFSKYKDYEITLKKGDSIFVYTDGVAEATNAEEELFGTERTIDALNDSPDAGPEQTLKNVRAAVDEFVKDAPQFDDLTMMCLKYYGTGKE